MLAEACTVHLQGYSLAVAGRGKECDLRGDPLEVGGIPLLRLGTVQNSLQFVHVVSIRTFEGRNKIDAETASRVVEYRGNKE